MNAVVESAPQALAEQARSLGVADRYHGFWGKAEMVSAAVLERAVAAMAGCGGEKREQRSAQNSNSCQ